MDPIHLVIPDSALREAVLEQLKLAGFDAVKECAHLIDALKNDAVVVIDEAAFDKKARAALPTANATNTYILLLGVTDADEHISESFPKPVRLGHLLARLKFYLETAPRLRGTALAFGPFRLEPHNRQIIASDTGAVIRLTEKETALLEYLGQSNAPVAREELLAAIWGYDARIDTHTLETHVYQLRRKLSAHGGGETGFLVNEQGAYRLTSSID